VSDLSSWTTKAEEISGEMQAVVKVLTSCIATLESATSVETTNAPSLCDEEGSAKGNIEKLFHQGDGSMGKSLNSALVTGDKKILKVAFSEYNIPEHSCRKYLGFVHQHDSREYKLPKIDFRKFEGEHHRVWRESVRSISLCTMCLFISGFLLPP
jgi:hypothetical protein